MEVMISVVPTKQDRIKYGFDDGSNEGRSVGLVRTALVLSIDPLCTEETRETVLPANLGLTVKGGAYPLVCGHCLLAIKISFQIGCDSVFYPMCGIVFSTGLFQRFEQMFGPTGGSVAA